MGQEVLKSLKFSSLVKFEYFFFKIYIFSLPGNKNSHLILGLSIPNRQGCCSMSWFFFILCIGVCVETLNLSIPVKFYSRETNGLGDMVAQSSYFFCRGRHTSNSEK